MGYFAAEGLDPVLEGTVGATDNTKMVATGLAEFAWPSPYVLIVSKLSGMPIKSFFAVDQRNVFAFAVRPDSDIKSIKDLKGKKIVLGSAGWSTIADPQLMNAGVNPKDSTYVVGGEGRAQLVWEGKADAVLTWQKEFQMWAGQGLKFRILPCEDVVQYQGNSLVASDTLFKKRPDLIVKFGRAMAMGLLWVKTNPEGATEVALDNNPKLKVAWPDAVAAVKALVYITNSEYSDQYGFGIHVSEFWEKLQDDMVKSGTITKTIPVGDYFTNEFIREMNNFDHAKVINDAKAYKVRKH
jgi:ABC-type nitrate/sulfonate/bicarbonate transport system substrate-binding protein